MSDDKRHSLRAAWRLAKPYWTSDDKWRAWGLLIAVVVLNLSSVALNVRFNLWNKDFYNSLQEYKFTEFKYQLLLFCGLAAVYIIVLVYQYYLQQMLQIRWRRWLTRRFLDMWLDERAYYRLQLIEGGTDNPDQRISEDLDRFTNQSLSLFVGANGFLNSFVTLLSFLTILWNLSGSVAIPLGSLGTFEIPGYMVFFAFLYAVLGTWLAIKIGRHLVVLNFNQQRYEADFRFSMMRLRENTESVALYGGETSEREGFVRRFDLLVDNFWSIMKRMKRLNWFTSGYGQFATVFPFIVASPRYFAKKITFGDLTQTADAFGYVQQSLSVIINLYGGYGNTSPSITEWQSVVQRLETFENRARTMAVEARKAQPIKIERTGAGLSVMGLQLDLPNGRLLKSDIHFDVKAGEWLLITGVSGSGKSTLLRAIAGIWPFGNGTIRVGEGRALFLPQKPYLPLGTLRGALLYPNEDVQIPNERLAAVLAQTGLDPFTHELETLDNWAHRLSPGEQQRLAFARVLLTEPAFIFMDEATSSLDEASEAALYGLLRKAPWKPTVVSIGHRRSLGAFHDLILPFAEEED